jgi:hypothetical protein
VSLNLADTVLFYLKCTTAGLIFLFRNIIFPPAFICFFSNFMLMRFQRDISYLHSDVALKNSATFNAFSSI